MNWSRNYLNIRDASQLFTNQRTQMSIIHLYKNNQLFFLNLFFIILALRVKLHDATRSVYLKLEHKSITILSRGSPKTSKNQIVSSKNRPIKKDTDSRNLNVHWSLQTITINLKQKRKLVVEFNGPLINILSNNRKCKFTTGLTKSLYLRSQ